MLRRCTRGGVVGVVFMVLAAVGHAQWATQAIPLSPGWNAVFLEVQPENNACDAVSAGLPVESVWAWNRRFEPVRYIQDAAGLDPDQPEWLTYYPPGTGWTAATAISPAATTASEICSSRPPASRMLTRTPACRSAILARWKAAGLWGAGTAAGVPPPLRLPRVPGPGLRSADEGRVGGRHARRQHHRHSR